MRVRIRYIAELLYALPFPPRRIAYYGVALTANELRWPQGMNRPEAGGNRPFRKRPEMAVRKGSDLARKRTFVQLANSTEVVMGWRGIAVTAAVVILIMIALFYSGAFMHGDP